MAEDAGALLVRSGLVSTSALEQARAHADSQGGTLGEHLVAADVISDDALTEFYTSRLLVPQVNPNSLARLPIRVVAFIPSDLAVRLRAIPVTLDDQNNLTLAMGDPSDRHAVDEIEAFTTARVVRAVATQMQIAWCLAHYYGHVTELGQRLLQTSSAQPPRPGPAPKEAAAPTAADAVPAPARTRSLSGEIQVPRTPAATPVPVDTRDESGPVITIEVSLPDEPTAPSAPAPRRRDVKSDPPELAARAGEVDIASGPVRRLDLEEPRIIIADDVLGQPRSSLARNEAAGELVSRARGAAEPAPIAKVELAAEAAVGPTRDDRHERETTPIPMSRPRAALDGVTITQRAPSAADDPDDEDDVVVLDAIKPRPARPAKVTQVGIGPAQVTPRPAAEGAPRADAGDDDRTSVRTLRAPTRTDDLTGRTALPPIARAPSAPDPYDDEPEPPTAVMSARELDAAIPHRTVDVVPAHLHDRRSAVPFDDGWGPPGATIPPPLLGALPGTEADRRPGHIPVPSVDSAPLLVARPAPPEVDRGRGIGAGDPSAVRALEEATSRLIELVRALEHARARDEVVAIMIDHLAHGHRRAGFFVVKPGATKGATELTVFAIQPRPALLPYGVLRLDLPSTFQDVVGTRLPYRGPVADEVSRAFLTSALGACPPEILLVPIAVRERVVGVLFGEYRQQHAFDDQLALASRAAGMALERILKSRRG